MAARVPGLKTIKSQTSPIALQISESFEVIVPFFVLIEGDLAEVDGCFLLEGMDFLD